MKKEEFDEILASLKVTSLKVLTDFGNTLKNANTACEKEWALFWLTKAEQSIINMNNRMKALSEKNMLVYDSTVEARPFWIDIIDTVKKSIRTTNILSQNSIGKLLNTELLIKQKNVIENGVKIHRVFVYDPNNHDEVAELVSTLSTQLLCKINVYVIEKDIFKSDSVRRGYNLGKAEDFMIIDDKYVYETIHDDKSASYRNRLIDDADNLNVKNKIWNAMMTQSITITFENVNTFNKAIS